MAENYEVFEVFIKPMKRIFSPPNQLSESDETAVITEYAEALKPYSKTVLQEAWKDVRDSHTARSWPTIAVCLKACRAAKKNLRPESHAKAIGGRMVDGIWHPWVGCDCERCLEARAQYRRDNQWWTDFMEELHPIAPILEQVKGMSEDERFAMLRNILAQGPE